MLNSVFKLWTFPRGY